MSGRKIDLTHANLGFLKAEVPKEVKPEKNYKILIADDDPEIHVVTKMMLRNFLFEERGMECLHAYNKKETLAILSKHRDIAVLFLDVVMDETHSGLDVIVYLREELKNNLTRIVLRTGQPGEAPEESVIRNYDINDYRLKTEMTVKRLHTTLYSALRSYRDLLRLENHAKGLERIVKTSATLFQHTSLNEFLTQMLTQVMGFQHVDRPSSSLNSGFVTNNRGQTPVIAGATGRFEPYLGQEVFQIEELSYFFPLFLESGDLGSQFHKVEGGLFIRVGTANRMQHFLYIEGDMALLDVELIHLFLAHYSMVLDNFLLTNMITSTQKEIIITLGEVVESHFEETGGHVKRISDMMYRFALYLKLSFSEAEVLRIASTMHDIGKVAVPDAILKKTGKLTEEEFAVIKTHTHVGHKILSKSELDIIRIAAEIAHYHHERYDGTGYPEKLRGKNIPINARMLAIVDVFDAMTHKRVYKEASTIEEALDYIREQRGKHFDPLLADIFLENFHPIQGEKD